jgi:5-methylcytosine-specific restriction endonuclease McrA
MSANKKLVRQKFRDACYKRDGHRCRICRVGGVELDAHHITDRNEMPNGGYVKENGISLCPPCHEKAEVYHSSGKTRHEPGYHPDDLYRAIGSSLEQAIESSKRLRP